MKENNNYLSLIFTIVMIGITFFNQKNNGEETIKRAENFSPTKNAASVATIVNLNPIQEEEKKEGLFKGVEEIKKTVEEEVSRRIEEEVNYFTPIINQENDLSEREEEKKEEVLLPDFEVKAREAVVYDLTAKKEIYSLNKEEIWPLASLAKIMTAIKGVEEMGFDFPITITEEAVKTEEAAGDFKPEEEFTVRDVILSLFLVSSNDGAEALAGNFGRDDFIAKMNEKARELEMTKTWFNEPAGLSDGTISSGEDLKKLMVYVYSEKPELLYFSRQAAAEITDMKFGDKKNYTSINEFAGNSNFIGGKTGYTEAAGGNLISVFSKNNHAILIIVLGTEDRFLETKKLLEWVKI